MPLEIVLSEYKLKGTTKAVLPQIKDRACCLLSLQKDKPVIGAGYALRRQAQTGHGFRTSEADRLENRTLRPRMSGRNYSVSAMPPA